MHGMMKPSPMMDKPKSVKAPKVSQDFDEKTQVAGKTNTKMPDRDGPAKRSADPAVKKPVTSAKVTSAKVTDTSQPAPASQQNAGIKSQSGMPAGMKMPTLATRKLPMAKMPDKTTMASMKASLGGMGRFAR
jgi:hypothetical protein